MEKKINVLVIGGGTGQSAILRGLKQLDNIKLSTIVTVADDGGSTGRLRRAFHIPAMGDIRNVMTALAESESLFSTLLDYRFDTQLDEDNQETELSGHNLGNIILTALTQKTGNFLEAVSMTSQFLKVKGRIVPSTYQVVGLMARMEDGTIVRGESNIPKVRNHILSVFYDEEVHANPEAVEVIRQADIIIYGIGSLYTSICPNLIIEEIKEALKESKARKIYLANIMTQPGETDDYSLEDHVRVIENYSHSQLDLVIMADDEIPADVVERYHEKEAKIVACVQNKHPYEIRTAPLLNFDRGRVRHDSDKIKKVFEELLKDVS